MKVIRDGLSSVASGATSGILLEPKAAKTRLVEKTTKRITAALREEKIAMWYRHDQRLAARIIRQVLEDVL